MEETVVEGKSRVLITPEAAAFVEMLKEQYGALLFHQSGGCCDGSAPMCLPASDFRPGENDVLLGEVAGIPFYMSGFQFEYWKHTQLTVDITTGRGASFSVEIPYGKRFIIHSALL